MQCYLCVPSSTARPATRACRGRERGPRRIPMGSADKAHRSKAHRPPRYRDRRRSTSTHSPRHTRPGRCSPPPPSPRTRPSACGSNRSREKPTRRFVMASVRRTQAGRGVARGVPASGRVLPGVRSRAISAGHAEGRKPNETNMKVVVRVRYVAWLIQGHRQRRAACARDRRAAWPPAACRRRQSWGGVVCTDTQHAAGLVTLKDVYL